MQNLPKIVSLSLNQTNFVPNPTVPQVFKVRGYPWMSYGVDNAYPQYITELYTKSAINRTALISKSIGVVGQGLRTKDPSLEYVLNRINDEESWNEVFEKAATDYEIYSGIALNIVWNSTGDKIHSIYHIPFPDVRSGDIDPTTDKTEIYYYSSNWAKFRRNTPISYQSFDPTKALEFPSQILYYFDYSPGSRYYPVPSYSGSCSDIQIDIETSTFHLSNLANGLNPSLWINFNDGIPDPEAQQDLYQNIGSAFSGVENTGKFFATFSRSKDSAPEVTPIQSVNDEYYITLETRVTTRILTGHRITSPLLLGLYHEGGSGLGSNKDEIVVAYNHFQATVLNPDIKALLKPFDKLMKYYGYDTKLYVEPLRLFEATATQEAMK
jgi:hypothetical protein